MKRNRFTRLFKNNKFLLILSLIISIAIWITMSLSDTNDTNATINDIPIQINLSDDAVDNGLQIFTGNDQKASVTVSGNRLSIGSISNDDIIVSAPTAGTISTAGTYPLSLTAKKANSSDRFEIVSTVSPSVITIFVDQFKESDFDIINKITYKVSKGYHAVVTTSAESITVSGPQSEVEKVASVGIVGEISGELKDNTSLECDVKLFDNSGSVITSNLLTLSDEKVTANFSVLPYKEVPVKLAFKNQPSELNMDYYSNILPDTIKIAAEQSVLDKLTSISTTPIDFNKLKNKSYDFEQKLDIPSKCVNISDTDTVDVKLNLSSFKTKTLKVSSEYFTMTGLGDGYSYSIDTDSLNITLVGPRSELSRITESDLNCEIDGSSIDGTIGSIPLPVKFKVDGNSSCWVTGSYKVNVNVDKNA
ncbi:MAG: hypothetical protein K6F88_03480 [Ruminococcus sp.]|nr:hypothetical protein [Ruminococcus sp.]